MAIPPTFKKVGFLATILVSNKTFALLMSLPAVQKVSAVIANGLIKHYNVQVRLREKGVEEELVKLWPFGNISTDGETTTADYIVKPEEVESFYVKMLELLAIPDNSNKGNTSNTSNTSNSKLSF